MEESRKVELNQIVRGLPSTARENVCYLGIFATSPATFDDKAFAAVARTENAREILNIYAERGLVKKNKNRYECRIDVSEYAFRRFDGITEEEVQADLETKRRLSKEGRERISKRTKAKKSF